MLGGIELKAWGGSPRILASPFQGQGPSIAGVVLAPPRLLSRCDHGLAAPVPAWFFRRTTFGLAILAAAQDVVGVRLTGIRLRHLSAFTWGVSSVVGAMAGIVIALSLGAFAPFFMARIMLLGFAAAVLGGMTSLPGALVGGIVVGVTQAVVSHYWISVAGLVEAVMFGAIVAVLLASRPQGCSGRPREDGRSLTSSPTGGDRPPARASVVADRDRVPRPGVAAAAALRDASRPGPSTGTTR